MTNLTVAAVGLTSFSLSGKGAPNTAYGIYASTNVTLPMCSWVLIVATTSTAGGVIQFTDLQATSSQPSYRFGQ